MTTQEEELLRNNIRQLIEVVKHNKSNKEQKLLSEEKRLREIIRSLITHEIQLLEKSTIGQADPPTDNTGVNKLNGVLNIILPQLEDFYKSLTTSIDQRKSFRAHIIKAIVNELTPVEVNTGAAQGAEEVTDLSEVLEVDFEDEVGPPADPTKLLDPTGAAAEAEEEEEMTPEEEFSKGLGLEDEEKTGRDFAFDAFESIKGNIVPVYANLHNPRDQEPFFDYLITNVKLWFNTFEDQLADTVEEPTNQAYEDAEATAATDAEAETAPEEAGGEEEIELDFAAE